MYIFNGEIEKALETNNDEELGRLFLLLATNVATKFKINDDDKVSEVVFTLWKSRLKFDFEKGLNAFAYFSSVAINAFRATFKNKKLISLDFAIENGETDFRKPIYEGRIPLAEEEKSIAQISRETGVAETTLSANFKKNKTLKQILKNQRKSYKRVNGYKQRLYFDQYTFSELQQVTGICASTLEKKLSRGLSLEQIFKKPTPKIYFEKYTMRELIEISKTPETTIRRKLEKGCSLEEIIKPDGQRSDREIIL